jgi:hypothetical protein
MSSDKWPEPGEMSASEEREYALDIERDSSRDERRVTTWRIDLEGPSDLGADDEREAWRRREVRLAQDRVGNSDEDRMQWLLRFGSRDLTDLSAEEWSNLLFEILVFAAQPFDRFVLCEVFLVEGEIKLDYFELRTLHAWVQSGLRGLRESPYVIVDENNVASDAPREWRVGANVEYCFTWENDRLVDKGVGDSGSTTNRFKVQLANTFARQAYRIRLCQNRDCVKLFLAHKRQIYCSGKCSDIVRKRRQRKKHLERIRNQRRAAYEREQRRRHGPKVKVARRPQRAKP